MTSDGRVSGVQQNLISYFKGALTKHLMRVKRWPKASDVIYERPLEKLLLTWNFNNHVQSHLTTKINSVT